MGLNRLLPSHWSKKIEGISTIRDESDRKGMRIVYVLKREAVPNIVLNMLYKYTQLQSTFSINNIALVNGRPQILNLKDCKDPDDFIKKYKKEVFLKAIDEAISHIQFQINILKKKFDLKKDEHLIKFAKEAALIIKSLSSPVEKDYYIKYVSKEYNIGFDAMKEEVYGKNYNNKIKNYKKFSKFEQKHIEKIKNIENGEKFVEETFIKLLLDNKELRQISLLKISEDDFLINDSKEIFNLIIKNKELDKITIDKIKDLNISQEYLNDLDNISINNINTYNSKNVDEIIKSVKRNKLHKEVNELLQQQKQLELSLKNHAIDKDSVKEVELEIMNITLKILDRQKSLKGL